MQNQLFLHRSKCDIRYPTLLLTFGIDHVFQIILIQSKPHYDNLHMWTNFFMYTILLCNILISLVLLIITCFTFKKRPEIKFKIMDSIFVLYFLTKCIYETLYGTSEISFFKSITLFTFFHLLQGTITFNYLKSILALPYILIIIYYIVATFGMYQETAVYIAFLVIVLINDIIIQVARYKDTVKEKVNQSEVQKEMSFLNDLMNQLNFGLLSYDKNFKQTYRNQYIDFIESLAESCNQLDNVSSNRTEINHLPLIQSNILERPSFLDEIKIIEYNSCLEFTSKRQITLRIIVENCDSQSEHIHYCLKLLGPNIEKYKFLVKYKQIVFQGEQLNVFTFQLMNEINTYNACKKDQKFRNNLISSFSHKLKTPLHTVLTYLETSMKDSQVNQQVINKYIKPCYWNSKIQLYLIQDILDYVSQYSQQKQSLNVTAVDMNVLLSEIKDLISTQCSQKGIRFEIFYNDEIFTNDENNQCIIQTDLNKLMRILINLLNNAYRFTHSGGLIELKVNEIKTQSSRMLSFVVSDNGMGISPQAQEEIAKQVQIHQQISLSSSRKEGTYGSQSAEKTISQSQKKLKNQILGISLKITTKLINQLNNTCPFHIESVPGQGSKFYFSICDLDLATSLLCPQSGRRKKPQSQSQNQISQIVSRQQESQQLVESEKIIVGEVPNMDRVKPSMIKGNLANSFVQYTRQISKSIKGLQSQSSIRQLIQRKSKQNLAEESGQIVIVDDEPFNHISLEMMLKSLGYQRILHCYNGQEIVDLVKRQKLIKIRTVLMDVDMPVLDGISASRILSGLMDSDKISPFQIIACTAHEDEETKQSCFDAGIEQIVLKPVFPSILQEALQIQS